MKIKNAIDALDTANDILDNLLGMAETLRLKGQGNGPEDDDCVSKMLSQVAYQQVDRLMSMATWLESVATEQSDKKDNKQIN